MLDPMELPVRRFMRTALTGMLCAAAVGCSTIWGFEDAVPMRGSDGGMVASGPCACVAAAPDGWEGPFELFEGSGAPAPDPPSCGGAYLPTPAFTGFASPGDAGATCACTCSRPSSTCSAPEATVFADGICSKPCGTVAIGESCTSLDPVSCNPGGQGPGGGKGGVTSVTIGPSVASPGTCTAQPTADVGPAPWTQSARLCAPAGAQPVSGCDAASSVCAPATAVGFAADTYCILRPGTAACPAETYTFQRTYYASASDTRGCSACTCDAPTGVDCAGVGVSTYADTTCASRPGTTAAPSGCIAASAALLPAASTIPGAGSCIAHAGQPLGMFSPTNASTICCTK